MALGKETKNIKVGGFFEGIHFFIELGVISSQRKKELVSSIEKNGGSIDFVISKKTTHVVTLQELFSSYKLKSAHNHGCFFVLEQFITDCVKAGKRLDEWPYLFLGDAPATTLGASTSTEYVGLQVARAFANVTSVMNAVYSEVPAESISEGILNIAALCAGLGATIPKGKFPVQSIVNNLYSTVLFNPKKKVPKVETVLPTIQQQPSPKKVIHTPLFREIAPPASPLSSARSSLSSHSHSLSHSSHSSLSAQSANSHSLSHFAPNKFRSTFSATPVTAAPAAPSSSSFSFSTSSISTTLRPPLKTTATSSSSSSSSSSPSPSPFASSLTLPSRTSLSTPSQPTSTASKLAIPVAPKSVSYSFAQYEEERRKKREEEKAKRLEEGGSVTRERETKRREEEEARKKAIEDKKLEILEKRKQEDEERKQKNREISEARKKRIIEERKKRELALEKLKQKPTHDLLTTAFFQQWDQEENDKKSKEEWESHMKEMEAWKAKEEAKEKAAQERAERQRVEKERKALEREQQQKSAIADKAALKIQRREEYERNKETEALLKKQEFEEKQAKLLEEFLKRQARREKKMLQGLQPEIKINYDDRKIFVGGIKLDDITAAKLPAKVANRVRSERINAVLRMFDAFGPVHERRVCADSENRSAHNTALKQDVAHCFITYERESSVQMAVETMKDLEARKKGVEMVKAYVAENKLHKLCVPLQSFYVRAPKQDKKKNKKDGKEEENDSDDALSDDTPFTTVPSRPPPSQPSATAALSSPSKPSVSSKLAPKSSISVPAPSSKPTIASSAATVVDNANNNNEEKKIEPNKYPQHYVRGIALNTTQFEKPRDPIPTSVNSFCILDVDDDEYESNEDD